MVRKERVCPKCNGNMQEGFINDQAYGASLVSRWVQGQPERSLLTGIKLKGRTMIETRTYRCDKCGFLESYANQT